jgi:hypothetical protein
MLFRLRAASLFLLIAVAAVSALPKIDLPETAFDETDIQTIQAVVTTETASSKSISSEAAPASIPLARTREARVRSISLASDSRQFREPLCIIRC